MSLADALHIITEGFWIPVQCGPVALVVWQTGDLTHMYVYIYRLVYLSRIHTTYTHHNYISRICCPNYALHRAARSLLLTMTYREDV